jgi:hypothetical protein
MIYTTFYNKNGMITSNLQASEYVSNAAILNELELGNKSINGHYNKNEYYIENNTPVEIPLKPDHYSIFNYETKEWEYPNDYLDKIKSNMVSSVNSYASEKILSRYPDYLQRNILASGDADLITEAWDYINSIRDLSNSANDTISSAQDTQEIEAIYQDYLTQLMEL